jgi:hypothetical protein
MSAAPQVIRLDASCCRWRYRPEANAMAGYATSHTPIPGSYGPASFSVKRCDAAAAEKIAPRKPCPIWLVMAGEKRAI